MLCPSHLAPLPVDWFNTGHDPISTFRFRGGPEAPTTCGMILDLPGNRRFIPARPCRASPPRPGWQRSASMAGGPRMVRPPCADDEVQIALVEVEVTAGFAGCCTVRAQVLRSVLGRGLTRKERSPIVTTINDI